LLLGVASNRVESSKVVVTADLPVPDEDRVVESQGLRDKHMIPKAVVRLHDIAVVDVEDQIRGEAALNVSFMRNEGVIEKTGVMLMKLKLSAKTVFRLLNCCSSLSDIFPLGRVNSK
jgi:hypothetical protein